MSGKKILLLPTVVINGNQYRGRLDVPAVTRALCAGFSETTEPSVRARCAAWDLTNIETTLTSTLEFQEQAMPLRLARTPK